MTPILRLLVIVWVKINVVKDDGAGGCQVDSLATRTSRQQEDENLWVVVEFVYQLLPMMTKRARRFSRDHRPKERGKRQVLHKVKRESNCVNILSFKMLRRKIFFLNVLSNKKNEIVFLNYLTFQCSTHSLNSLYTPN